MALSVCAPGCDVPLQVPTDSAVNLCPNDAFVRRDAVYSASCRFRILVHCLCSEQSSSNGDGATGSAFFVALRSYRWSKPTGPPGIDSRDVARYSARARRERIRDA
jgi:hypothetical protein